jgi:hypothetical protein
MGDASGRSVIKKVAISREVLSGTHANIRSSIKATNTLAELRAFWGQALEIDGSAIRLQRKSNSGQLAGRSWRSQHGVLTVTLNDTLLRARLQAWIDRVMAGWV